MYFLSKPLPHCYKAVDQVQLKVYLRPTNISLCNKHLWINRMQVQYKMDDDMSQMKRFTAVHHQNR